MTGKVNNGPVGTRYTCLPGNSVQACLWCTRTILIILEHEDVPRNAIQTATLPLLYHVKCIAPLTYLRFNRAEAKSAICMRRDAATSSQIVFKCLLPLLRDIILYFECHNKVLDEKSRWFVKVAFPDTSKPTLGNTTLKKRNA